ncbi:MAG TPA: hypothetical protein VHZ03_27910 [Trebonia sp.]|nr:hypothetical protein [Trebonia sp.]
MSVGLLRRLYPVDLRRVRGEMVVCTGAIRDEGVSHHYAPAEKFAWPSGTLTRRLAQALAAGGTAPHSGLAWTIDAPYRETMAEARSYQAEGVVCVEMEAAALFTVGRYGLRHPRAPPGLNPATRRRPPHAQRTRAPTR